MMHGFGKIIDVDEDRVLVSVSYDNGEMLDEEFDESEFPFDVETGNYVEFFDGRIEPTTGEEILADAPSLDYEETMAWAGELDI